MKCDEWGYKINNSWRATYAHRAAIGAMTGRCQIAAMSLWRANGGLPPKHHTVLMAGRKHHSEQMAGRRRAHIMFMQFKQRNTNDVC